MDSLIFTFNAILPIVLLVALGYFLKKVNLISDAFIKDCHKFNFRWGFFAMIFCNMYSIQSFSKQYADLLIFASLSILSIVFIGFVLGGFFVKDPKQKGVITQATFRSNFAIIGIPLAQSLFGDEAAKSAALLVSVTIPIFNIFSVIALTVFIKDESEKKSIPSQIKSIFIKLLKNPMIEGVLAGGFCILIRPYLGGWTLKGGSFGFIYKTLETLSKMCTPLALIMLGGQFKFSAVKRLLPKIVPMVLIRIVIVPLLGLLAAHYFYPQFGGPEYAGFIALFGTPVAVASAIMADQMGNDGELAGQILVWSTIFSAFSLFGFIFFFRAIGLF